MKIQHIIKIATIIGCFLILSSTQIEAQKRIRKEEPSYTFKEHLWWGVNIGSPYLFQNVFGIGLGPMIGYNFNQRFAAGLIANVNYEYHWNLGNKPFNYFDYSLGVFGRAKILLEPKVFFQAEYNYTSIAVRDFSKDRIDFPVLFIGGGYNSGYPIGYEVSLLFDVLGNLSLYRIPLEYRFAVTYNF
jgi:hypothetical protein